MNGLLSRCPLSWLLGQKLFELADLVTLILDRFLEQSDLWIYLRLNRPGRFMCLGRLSTTIHGRRWRSTQIGLAEGGLFGRFKRAGLFAHRKRGMLLACLLVGAGYRIRLMGVCSEIRWN